MEILFKPNHQRGIFMASWMHLVHTAILHSLLAENWCLGDGVELILRFWIIKPKDGSEEKIIRLQKGEKQEYFLSLLLWSGVASFQ